jgi:hypothetical protein
MDGRIYSIVTVLYGIIIEYMEYTAQIHILSVHIYIAVVGWPANRYLHLNVPPCHGWVHLNVGTTMGAG